MTKKFLAIRVCEHDSNFSYYNGKEIKYYKSEREFQQKHHAYHNLWNWKTEVNRIFGIDYKEVDEIAIIVDPWHHNIPSNNEMFFPEVSFNEYIPSEVKLTRIDHHYAHALSSFMLEKEYDYAFVIDGFGDDNIAWSVFKEDKLIDRGILSEVGSLGLEMADASKYLGIEAGHVLDLAGKLMGLQAYGKIDTQYYNLLKMYDIGSVSQIFNKNLWYGYKGSELLGNLTALDWIATVHKRAGETIVELFKKYAKPNDRISYSGGVAQNVIWNTELKKHFNSLTIPPHCADDGLSLGGIEYLRKKHKLPPVTISNFPYCQTDEGTEQVREETIEKAAKLLEEGKILAWYQNNGEIGPRALGNRSILLNPLITNAKDKINEVKNRENYRPFGASILKEHLKDYFKEADIDNPHMLYVYTALENTKLSSILHVDNTCRVQTVEKSNHPFRKLLEVFYKNTGIPILLNTSLNLAGKPIAGYQNNALELFNNSKIDVLIIGNRIYDSSNR